MDSVQSKSELKRKHVTLTISNKLKVIEKLKKGTPGKTIAKEFGISIQTVSDIKKQTDSIEAYAHKLDEGRISKKKTLKGPKEALLESKLYEWYKAQRANGASVSTKDLQSAAENLTKQIPQLKGFNCNLGWVYRFKTRHNINKKNSENVIEPISEPCSSQENGKKDEPVIGNCSNSTKGPTESVVIKLVKHKDIRAVKVNEPSLIEEPSESLVIMTTNNSVDSESNREESVNLNNSSVFTPIEEPTESVVIRAAKDGIDAVLEYVGYSSNRKLWSCYEQLRTVREMIIEEQKEMPDKYDQTTQRN